MTSTDAKSFLTDLFAVIDSLDIDRLIPRVSDDITFQFGSAEVVTGKPDFTSACREFVGALAGLRHEITSAWAPEPDTFVAVARVHYRRADGHELTLPACSIFRVRAKLVVDYRIYMDINPLFATAG